MYGVYNCDSSGRYSCKFKTEGQNYKNIKNDIEPLMYKYEITKKLKINIFGDSQGRNLASSMNTHNNVSATGHTYPGVRLTNVFNDAGNPALR